MRKVSKFLFLMALVAASAGAKAQQLIYRAHIAAMPGKRDQCTYAKQVKRNGDYKCALQLQ